MSNTPVASNKKRLMITLPTELTEQISRNLGSLRLRFRTCSMRRRFVFSKNSRTYITQKGPSLAWRLGSFKRSVINLLVIFYHLKHVGDLGKVTLWT